MTFRTLTVSILAAMYLADFCRYSNTAEIGDLQHVLEAVSEESLSSLAESKDINWPSMSLSFSAIPAVPGASGAVRVSQNIALKLLDLLKGYESSLDNDSSVEPINQFKIYSLVGMRLERAGGSLKLCLLDSLNRCVMARLCHSVLSASLGLEAAQKTLESLYVPKCGKSFLENLMFTRMSRDQAASLFAKLPPTRLQGAVFNFEEFGSEFSDAMVRISPKLKTSVLVTQENISPLVYRLIESWGLRSALIPGLLDYLSKGGKIEDLPIYCGDFPKFRELMGASVYEYRLESEGETFLDPSSLLFLVNDFGGDFRKSKFYRLAL